MIGCLRSVNPLLLLLSYNYLILTEVEAQAGTNSNFTGPCTPDFKVRYENKSCKKKTLLNSAVPDIETCAVLATAEWGKFRPNGERICPNFQTTQLPGQNILGCYCVDCGLGTLVEQDPPTADELNATGGIDPREDGTEDETGTFVYRRTYLERVFGSPDPVSPFGNRFDNLPVTTVGAGWILVRWVAPGDSWHAADDKLVGTDTYGDSCADLGNGVSEGLTSSFTVPWKDELSADEYLFSDGDGKNWLICNKLEIVNPTLTGQRGANLSPLAMPTNIAEIKVTKSSRYGQPHMLTWRVSGQTQDYWEGYPQVSLRNVDSPHQPCGDPFLYVGNSAKITQRGGCKSPHKGYGVFVRNGPPAALPKRDEIPDLDEETDLPVTTTTTTTLIPINIPGADLPVHILLAGAAAVPLVLICCCVCLYSCKTGYLRHCMHWHGEWRNRYHNGLLRRQPGFTRDGKQLMPGGIEPVSPKVAPIVEGVDRSAEIEEFEKMSIKSGEFDVDAFFF